MIVTKDLPARARPLKVASRSGRLPALATLAVVLILYSNAAVVAVRFHGLPAGIGASVGLLLLLPLAYHLVVQRQALVVTSAVLPITLFLAAQMLGALFSSNVLLASRELSVFVLEGLGLYLLLTNAIRTETMLRRAIWTLLLAGAILGGLSGYQQATQSFDNNYWGFAQVSNAAFGTGSENLFGDVLQLRLAGPIGEQNRYAQIMLMLVPLGLSRFLAERSLGRRAAAAMATSLIGLGMALTFSRGAAVGLALMLLAMGLVGYLKLRHIVVAGLGVGVLVTALPQYGIRLNTLGDVVAAVSSGDRTLRSTDTSTQGRVTEMVSAALVFADYPLVGVGPGMFRFYYQEYAEDVGLRARQSGRQAHNLYLGLAAETGLLGLLSFLAGLWVTLVQLDQGRKRWMEERPELAHLAAGPMFALVTYMATGLFLHLAYIRYFWLMMALAGAAGSIAESEARRASAAAPGAPWQVEARGAPDGYRTA